MSTDPSRCPLCGQPNHCAIATGHSHCWCFETVIPAQAADRVPPEARGLACLCKACATGRRDPAQTLDQLQRLLRQRS
ncbi:MAG: cysteine-rich CWC family protein [Candidatus Contendobacter sp.]